MQIKAKAYQILHRLTLTAANYVHIVEPQWNPTVEEQAIGRALRMGQTRHVTILKYITTGTVEQVCCSNAHTRGNISIDLEKNIIHLQKRKSQLAKISLDGMGGDHSGEKVEVRLYNILWFHFEYPAN